VSEPRSTADEDYAARLARLQNKRWKLLLDVQRPYRWNVRRMDLGRTVEVGAGIGRLLRALPAGSVGVDHNAASVAIARAAGHTAMTSQEWDESALSAPGTFDSMLLAHVVEHMSEDDALDVVRHYLPALKPGGKVAFIVPQEVGYRSDPTHVRFVDVRELTSLADRLGLTVERAWSFPFPRPVGRLFIYNETCLLARVPAA
jgi:SAM-dependent methyltransferase